MSSHTIALLLVPGAFAPPDCFTEFKSHLQEAGLESFVGEYPSRNPANPATAICDRDISALLYGSIIPLLAQDKDIVILAHGYGGVVAGAAAKHLDRETRAGQGYANSIIGLIYVAGALTLENQSLCESVGGWRNLSIFKDTPRQDLASVMLAPTTMYNDCDFRLAQELASKTRPHAFTAFDTESWGSAWMDDGFENRRAYVRTRRDRLLPTRLQDNWLENCKVKWDITSFSWGHMPFNSQPEALAEHVVNLINGFAEV